MDTIRVINRGYLPHYSASNAITSITFRLADSIPKYLLASWAEEDRLIELDKKSEQQKRRARMVDHYLDKGEGSALLRDPSIAEIVQESLLYYAGSRYLLHAWVVMPNHVHCLVTFASHADQSKVVHTWKSFTAHRINKLRGGAGSIWQREYFDRLIRSERHFISSLHYIERNPVKAGLCEIPSDWMFSSASLNVESRIQLGVELLTEFAEFPISSRRM